VRSVVFFGGASTDRFLASRVPVADVQELRADLQQGTELSVPMPTAAAAAQGYAAVHDGADGRDVMEG
jgi:hypothetical protein